MRTARPMRAVLALLAVVGLAAACSGDDDGPATAATTDEPAASGEGCGLIDPADLSAVTGVEFDRQEEQGSGCVYTSTEGAAAITLTYADLEADVEPQHAIDQAALMCDEGTLQELEFTDADAGYGCLVRGVATVAATGGGTFAVLVGAAADPAVGSARILQDLATILEAAITRS
ncbi:MAG: hypothetical protein M3Z03_05815 [Actinomycetota bacterium]|nr:hypothetical protein [Actinomycetota bacterium]